MGRRGPPKIFTAEQLRERRRARQEAKRRAAGALPRAKNGSPEARAHAKSARERVHRGRVERNKAFVFAYKAAHPCVDCGFADARALTFDHRDRARKNFTISEWVLAGRGLDAIKAEIAKCDVRCANCHMIRSTGEQHWQPLEDWEIYAAGGVCGE